MNLSDAIREALTELGTTATGPEVRTLIHKKHPALREKLETNTYSATFSLLRKKAIEAEGDTPDTTKAVAHLAVHSPVARKISPAITDDLTPEEIAIAGFREAYKQLVSVVGKDLAHLIASRLMGGK